MNEGHRIDFKCLVFMCAECRSARDSILLICIFFLSWYRIYFALWFPGKSVHCLYTISEMSEMIVNCENCWNTLSIVDMMLLNFTGNEQVQDRHFVWPIACRTEIHFVLQQTRGQQNKCMCSSQVPGVQQLLRAETLSVSLFNLWVSMMCENEQSWQ